MATEWHAAELLSVNPDGTATMKVRPGRRGWPPPDKPFQVALRRPRSHKHNNLYWATLGKVVEATGRWKSKELLHYWLKYQLGLYRPVAVKQGVVYVVYESTDFDAMDQGEFAEFFDLAMAELSLAIGVDPLDLDPTTI